MLTEPVLDAHAVAELRLAAHALVPLLRALQQEGDKVRRRLEGNNMPLELFTQLHETVTSTGKLIGLIHQTLGPPMWRDPPADP